MLPVLLLAALITLSLLSLVWSSSPCIVASMQSSTLASSLPPFFDTYSLSTSSYRCKALCIVINFLVLWSICLSSLFVYFKNDFEYLKRCTARLFIPLMRFLLQSMVSRSVHILQRCPLLFLFPLHPRLFDGVSLYYPQILVTFLLSKRSNAFLIWQFYFFRCFSFSHFFYEHGTFFNAKFHSYILVVYSYCLYQVLRFFFFIFCKYFDIIHLFVWFSKFLST